MAYLRKEKETVEIDFPLSEVWKTTPSVISSLNWAIEQKDDSAHRVTVKTNAGFFSYSSKLIIEMIFVNEKTCRVTVQGETPVTTITSLADFGRTKDRIELFFETLAKQLTDSKKS